MISATPRPEQWPATYFPLTLCRVVNKELCLTGGLKQDVRQVKKLFIIIHKYIYVFSLQHCLYRYRSSARPEWFGLSVQNLAVHRVALYTKKSHAMKNVFLVVRALKDKYWATKEFVLRWKIALAFLTVKNIYHRSHTCRYGHTINIQRNVR